MKKTGYRVIAFALTAVMILGLTVLGFAETQTPSGSAHPYETANNIVYQGIGTATYIQGAANNGVLAADSAGKTDLELTFTGLETIKETLKGYDYVFLFDGSESPNQDATINSAKTFVSTILAQSPNSHFAGIVDGPGDISDPEDDLPLIFDFSNDEAEVKSGIDAVGEYFDVTTGTVDYVAPAERKAADLFEKHECPDGNGLMIVVIGDGDYAFAPADIPGIEFEVNYKGTNYRVTRTSGIVNLKHGKIEGIYGDFVGSMEGWGGSNTDPRIFDELSSIRTTIWNVDENRKLNSSDNLSKDYGINPDKLKIDRNEIDFVRSRHAVSMSHLLYFQKFVLEPLREKGIIIAGINVPKKDNASYAETVAKVHTCVIGRLAVDEGYSFEVNSNSTTGFTAAFTSLKERIQTKVVTMEANIDNRYFEFDSSRLALPDGCEYTLESVTADDGVPVQKVTVIYTVDKAQSLLEKVKVPVKIKAKIPVSAAQDGYLPVTHDSEGIKASTCRFVNLDNEENPIAVSRVWVDASKFLVEEHTLTVDAKGGTWNGETTQTVAEGETVTIADPTKNGCTFDGWDVSGTGASISGTTFTMGTSDAKLTAKWTQVIIPATAVTVPEINGGVGDEVSVAATQQDGTAGGTWSAEGLPEGLSIDPATGVISGTPTTPGEGTYTVTYTNAGGAKSGTGTYSIAHLSHEMSVDPNGGKWSDDTTAVKVWTLEEENTKSIARSGELTRKGYSLDCGASGTEAPFTVSPADSGSEVTLENASEYTFVMGVKDTTFTAKWKANQYTVTYDANGGEPASQQKKETFDQKYQLPETEPTKPGYVFDGWYTEKIGGEPVKADTILNEDQDHPLYAHWRSVSDLIDIWGDDDACVLLGKWRGQSEAELHFYVRYDGDVLKQEDLQKLTFKVEPLGIFTKADMGDLKRDGSGAVVKEITGVKEINGVSYAQVTVTLEMNKSGLLRVSCGFENAYKESGINDVAMPGDINADGKISSLDMSMLQRTMNDFLPAPAEGKEGNYEMSLYDMDGNGRLNSTDVSVLARMLNDLIASN